MWYRVHAFSKLDRIIDFWKGFFVKLGVFGCGVYGKKKQCCAGSRLQLVGICESMNLNPPASSCDWQMDKAGNRIVRKGWKESSVVGLLWYGIVCLRFVNGESIVDLSSPTVNLATNEGTVAGLVIQKQEAVTWRVIWEDEWDWYETWIKIVISFVLFAVVRDG